MKTFKQFLEEENYNGRTIIRHGIKISFYDGHIDYHKDNKLLHSQKGNYKVTNNHHTAHAYNTAERLQSNPDHYKARPNYNKK
jgi:antirestriction protein ArdC